MVIPGFRAFTACVEIKILRRVVLNRRVVFHAIDAMPARWRGDAGSSPLDGASTAAPSPSAPDALVDFHTAADGQGPEELPLAHAEDEGRLLEYHTSVAAALPST